MVQTSLKLGRLNGGINRFESEAGPDQCVDALDVWERNGDLVRRPAFMPVYTNAPYYLPAGAVHVLTIRNGVVTQYADRDPLMGNAVFGSMAAGDGVYIGCLYPFDGIELPIDGVPATITNNVKLRLFYIDGTPTLQPIYNPIDSTIRRYHASASSEFYVPLRGPGRISWDRSQFVSWTPTSSYGGSLSRYWIVINLSSSVPQLGETVTSTTNPTPGGDITIDPPGIRAFLLNPVNGLVSTRARGGMPVIIAGSDFAEKRGNVPGGGLGLIKGLHNPTEVARIVQDEGAGLAGSPLEPRWIGGTAADPLAVGASGMAKFDRTYDWSVDQFAPTTILEIAAASVSPNASTVNPAANWNLGFDSNFENYRIRVLTQPGPGGPAVGEEREIIYSDATLIRLYDAFSATPNGNETYEIRTHPGFARGNGVDIDLEIASNIDHQLTLGLTRSYQAAVPTALVDEYIQFELFKHCFWALNPGANWCATFDSVSGRTILTNGRNGLFAYDGSTLRKLEALWDPTDGVFGASLVRTITGILEDTALRTGSVEFQGTLLRSTPPDGAFVVDYGGRLVVAGGPASARAIKWSMPGYNNIWPLAFEDIIRDSENDPITGLATIFNKLIVFTATAIHASDPPNQNGRFNFAPISQGVGFLNHFAVAKIVREGSSCLIGPGPDGVYIFDGHSARAVLDDWTRVLPNGVNPGLMHKATGAAWIQENLYFLAVPSAGSTTVDRVLVCDYSGGTEKWWLWSAPYGGVTAIARDLDDSGRERILFGHANGHITVLANGIADCSALITGRARSKSVDLGTMTHGFVAFLAKMTAMGPGPTVTFRGYVNRANRFPHQAARTIDAEAADGVFGTSVFDAAVTQTGALYAADMDQTVKIHMTSGFNVGQAFAFELESTERFCFKEAELVLTPKAQRST